MTLKSSAKLASAIFLLCAMAIPFTSQAKDLFITDDYLKGLDDEVSSPEYLEKAKQELLATEKREKSGNYNATDEIQDALASMYNFEALIRTKFPSSHAVYSMLPTSSRILIFDNFKKTKMLSSAKRMIIEKYETQ